MKRQMQNDPKRVIPSFATEAEDADWWYKNRNIHGKQLLTAVRSGKWRATPRTSRTTTCW